MLYQSEGLTIPEVTHHHVTVNGTTLHYVEAGTSGSPVLLVHGFPESWWAFHRLIPLLASHHRVVAVDLRGFGDSDAAAFKDDNNTVATDLHALIEHLGAGPVHLLVQDISGTAGFRLAADHPQDLLSFTAVEAGLAGFGLEVLADVSRGGAWYIGVLVTPDVPEAFFDGRERKLIGDFILPSAIAEASALRADDVSELARGYARPGGWSGAQALYRAMLLEGAAIRKLADQSPLAMPTMAIDRSGSDFTFQTMSAVHAGPVRHATINDVGHYIAIEAPGALADKWLPFLAEVDGLL